MKKTFKVMIVLSLLITFLSANVSVFAAEVIENVKKEDTNNQEQIIENSNKKEQSAINEKIEEKQVESGNLNIQIDLRLPVENPNFTVILQKQETKMEIIPEFSKNESTLFFDFSNLEIGIYRLDIQGPGYLPYTQLIEINNETIELKLTNGHDFNNVQADSSKKVGVVSIGDINKDGVVDEQDETLMIQAIEDKTFKSNYDLNGDLKVDIIDLSYITLNKNKNVEGSLLHLLNVQGTDIQSKENTVVNTENGNLEDILKNNEKYVQLQPKNGEEISLANPVEITLDLKDNKNTSGAITLIPSENFENNIKSGEIVIVDENGKEITIQIGQTQQKARSVFNIVAAVAPTVVVESDGTIVINLNGQVAIKKITIKVTETQSNQLADISKVEFLNGMEDRIPAPSMDIPENLKGMPESERFSVSWNAAKNVTGYEVSITANGKTEYKKVDGNLLKVTSFNNDKIKNGTVFTVKVQSLNGNWKSGYCNPITVTPETNEKPAAPDNLKATGAFKSINLSWKDMKDTDSYSVYYREYESGNYIQAITNLEKNSYTIQGLKDQTKYQVYVTGTNKLGTSAPSIVSVATTISVQPVVMPKYKLINTDNGEGKLTNHIKNVTLNKGYMVDSTLDKQRSGLGIVDNNYSSYFQIDDWDLGAHYYGEKGPTVEFDNFYTMNYITFAQVQNLDDFGKAHIYYWDQNGNRKDVATAEVVMKKDVNGRDYTVIKLAEPITTNKVNVNIGRTYSYVNKITIAEMNFYYYDSIEKDINNLYSDQIHVTLRTDVTSQTIDELQARLDTKDEVSGEYNPEKENLQKEINTARDILNDKQIKQAIQIDTTVSKAYDNNITFSSGLNSCQPLGVVGYEDEKIIIYVGNPNLKIGAETRLQLVVTQYHAEASNWQKVVQNLKVGRNEILIPEVSSMDTERGGSLYINYTGKEPKDVYGVRVSGGQEIPVLDLTKAKSEEEKKARVKQYVEKLQEVTPNIEAKHNEIHKGSETKVDYDYKKENCILGATEIVIDQMMYSVSSEQMLKSLIGTTDQKANQLYNSLTAMNDMIDLFYTHKGLSTKPEAGNKNKYPTSRLNIRYQRMFAGAFMYAGGSHIGIEWGSVPGLGAGVPVKADENGKFESGQYFGWGIAHEIGHSIDEGAYKEPEITNNYFSVLAQAKDTNESVRFQYESVYKKVTSGTAGKSSDGGIQLGLYWQLHLAYDKAGYNYKKYNTYQEQFDNLIFARMNTYVRDKEKAPQPNGIALTLGSDKDNNLMRLAVAAANKNNLEFFERWGMIPDETTKAYASQFEKETRSIYYINDDARAYQLSNYKEMEKDTKVATILQKENNSNQIKIALGNTKQEENKDAILGYEIIRSYQDNDKEISRAVAFVTADKTEYIDTIETINNRVFTYKVIAYDKYLNKTEEYVLDPVKVSHDGSIKKDQWAIETTLSSDEDVISDGTQNLPCEQQVVKAITKITNNDYQDNYIGKSVNNNSEIIVSLDEVTSLVALKYKAGDITKAIKNYEIQISNDKLKWETVKSGEFTLDENNSQTVYFNKENDTWLYTYDATYVKLKITNQTEVSISEIDLLGQTGDNIELLKNGIGKLESNYKYGEKEDQYIPAGSIVFTGTYKGNPAYNAVKIWNQDNQLVEGSQIILANVPEKGELGEVSDGTWIYWIEPKDQETSKIPKTIRAELYRVDDAHTNQGERLVSDTYRTQVPEELPNIQISK